VTRDEVEQILVQEQPQFLRYAKSLCRDPDDAHDLFSQAVVSLLSYTKWQGVPAASGVQWVKSVIRQQWFQLKRKPRQRHQHVELEDTQSYHAEPTDPYLWNLVRTLSVQQQYILIECVVKQRTKRAVGEDLGWKRERVVAQLRRLLLKLRQPLTKPT